MNADEPITNTEDVLDSRDVLARIEYLFQNREANTEDPLAYPALDEDETRELAALEDLARQCWELDDWQHGTTLVRDSFFEDYTRELIEDVYPMPEGFDANAWPWRHMRMNYADAANELRQDYTDVTFDGVNYLVQ